MRQQSIQIVEAPAGADGGRSTTSRTSAASSAAHARARSRGRSRLERILAARSRTSRPPDRASRARSDDPDAGAPGSCSTSTRRAYPRVFSNLLANAAKFTPRGADAIAVSRAEPSGDGDCSVRDSGVRIPRRQIGPRCSTCRQLEPGPDRSQSALGTRPHHREAVGRDPRWLGRGRERPTGLNLRRRVHCAAAADRGAGRGARGRVRARESAIPAGDRRCLGVQQGRRRQRFDN